MIHRLIEQSKEFFNKMPDAIVACVGGGSNAMGAFYPFININQTRLIGVEAAGNGLQTGEHAAPLNDGTRSSSWCFKLSYAGRSWSS